MGRRRGARARSTCGTSTGLLRFAWDTASVSPVSRRKVGTDPSPTASLRGWWSFPPEPVSRQLWQPWKACATRKKPAFLPGGNRSSSPPARVPTGQSSAFRTSPAEAPGHQRRGALGEESFNFPSPPAGRLVAALGPDRRTRLFPLDGGAPHPMRGVEPGSRCGSLRMAGSCTFSWRAPDRHRLPRPRSLRERSLWREFHPDPPGPVASNTAVVSTTADRKLWFCATRTVCRSSISPRA